MSFSYTDFNHWDAVLLNVLFHQKQCMQWWDTHLGLISRPLLFCYHTASICIALDWKKMLLFVLFHSGWCAEQMLA